MIGGNISASIQSASITKNAIGEPSSTWSTVATLNGFLDLSGGDSKHTTYNAKIQESTHIFMCDYKALSAKAENARALINNEIYDILLIDDPMQLHEQLEIYLKYIGGQ